MGTFWNRQKMWQHAIGIACCHIFITLYAECYQKSHTELHVNEFQYLLIGLWHQAVHAAVSIQKLLELLVTDDKPLCIPQCALPCILPVDQQALEHLNTQRERERISVHTHAHTYIHTQTRTHTLFYPYLPSDRVELGDLLAHVLVDGEGVDDRVDFEGNFVLLAPVADFVEVVQVALLALSPADQLVGRFIKAVTGNGQDVQMVTWERKEIR